MTKDQITLLLWLNGSELGTGVNQMLVVEASFDKDETVGLCYLCYMPLLLKYLVKDRKE